MDTGTTLFAMLYFMSFLIVGIATEQWFCFVLMFIYPIIVAIKHALRNYN